MKTSETEPNPTDNQSSHHAISQIKSKSQTNTATRTENKKLTNTSIIGLCFVIGFTLFSQLIADTLNSATFSQRYQSDRPSQAAVIDDATPYLSDQFLVAKASPSNEQNDGQTKDAVESHSNNTVDKKSPTANDAAADNTPKENNVKKNNENKDEKGDNKTASDQPDNTPNGDDKPAQSNADKKPAPSILRMGTGSIGGNYFVLGQIIGGVVSHPNGSLVCGKGGTCGVAGLQTQNVATSGSIDNLNKLQSGEIATAFVQSDIAYWAYTGTGLFENRDKQSNLRAIASLYPEAIHLVARRDAQINSVADLVDKRVSVGDRRSGTLLGARLVLSAYNLTEDDMQTAYLNNRESIEKLANDELDALFFSVGVPAPAITTLFEEQPDTYQLIPISGPEQKSILRAGYYFSPYTIPAESYQGVGETETISVYALWLTTDSMDEELVYQLTKALWHEESIHLLEQNPVGQAITIDSSLDGIGIPLHNGAKRFYDEIDKRF